MEFFSEKQIFVHCFFMCSSIYIVRISLIFSFFTEFLRRKNGVKNEKNLGERRTIYILLLGNCLAV